MLPIELTTALSILGTLGTLPLGHGATIVIFGGIFALGTSLVWSMLSPRETAVPAAIRTDRRRVARPPMRRPVAAALVQSRHRIPPAVSDATYASMVEPSWLDEVAKAAEQAGFGRIQVLATGRTGVRVRLGACRSCHSRAARTTGCEIERYGLESAVKRHDPKARVVELHCRARDKRDCVFEVRSGGDE